MLKKTLFILFLALTGSVKLFAQSPNIFVADLPCSIIVCISAQNDCKKVSCAAPLCITIAANSPGVYSIPVSTGCLGKTACTVWDISFESGPCEGVQEDPPVDNLVKPGIPTSWASTFTGQGYVWRWDGTSFYIQD